MTQNEEAETVAPSERLAETVMGFDQGRQWLRTVLIEQCGADYNTARHLRDWLLPDHLFDQFKNAVDLIITDNEILTLKGLSPSLRITQKVSQNSDQSGLVMVVPSLRELVQAFQSYEIQRPHLEDFTATLYGMTASDLTDPARYWRQLAESYQNQGSYSDIKRRVIQLSPELQITSWQRPSTHIFYPYPMVTDGAISIESDSISTPLPQVNWRAHTEWSPITNHDQTVLTVSQIQTQQKSPTSVEQAKVDDVTMRGRLRNLMSFAQNHPRVWHYLFPDIPPQPRTVHNLEAWNLVVAHVALGTSRNELLGRGEQVIIQHLQDEFMLSQPKAKEIFIEYLTVIRGCRAIEGRLSEPKQAREAQSLQYKLFTKLDKVIPESWHQTANQLAEAYEQIRFPLGKYLAVLLLVSWMNKRGLSVLRFPTILPYQLHGERKDNQAGKLDKRIISHLQLVFEQMVKDVDGISWRVEPDQDGYAELEIGSELSSASNWINLLLNE